MKRNIKRTLIIGMLLVGGWAQAQETTNLSQSFSGGDIAGGNPIGSVFVGDFNQATPPDDVVSILTVDLNVSGGYASGFYAYLIAPNGTNVTLLNFPGLSDDPLGIGNTTLGLNLTLADGGPTITSTSDLMNGGTYAPAGSLGSFNGLLANGLWTLYFANTTSGGGDATLNSWALHMTLVPEPATIQFLATFGGLAAVGAWWRRRWAKP